MKALPVRLLEQARDQGSRTAFQVRTGDGWRSVTYGDLAAWVEELALGLLRLGAAPGDRIALSARNCPEWLAAETAIQLVGAVSVPIFPFLQAELIRGLIQESGARMDILDDPGLLQGLCTTPEAGGDPLTSILLTTEEEAPEECGAAAWSEILQLGRRSNPADRAVLQERMDALKMDAPATFAYTRWTSGPPRAAVLSHRNLHSCLDGAREVLPLGPQDRVLCTFPPSHLLGRLIGLILPLLQGAAVAMSPGEDHLMRDLRRIRPTVLISPPELYERVHEHHVDRMRTRTDRRNAVLNRALEIGRMRRRSARAGQDILGSLQYWLADRLVLKRLRSALGGQLRFGLCAGRTLPRRIGEHFADIGIPLLEAYELTEASSLVAVNRLGSERFGTAGLPLPGAELRITADGELMVRGSMVFLGYWNPETGRIERGTSVTASDWLLTGDLAQLSADGYLEVSGSLADMIATPLGGEISPRRVENSLRSHRMIHQVAVIGDSTHYLSVLLVPDFAVLERWAAHRGIAWQERGELLRKIRVLDRYHRIVAESTASLPRHERPKRFTLLPRPFSVEMGELTPTGRIRRPMVVRNFHREISELYS